MVCCGGSERREPVGYIRYLLALATTAAFNLAFVPLLLAAALALPRYRAVARFYLAYLADAAPSLLTEPDVSPQARCRLVGRLLPRAPALGGAIYRSFTPLCALSGAAAAMFAVGLAALMAGA